MRVFQSGIAAASCLVFLAGCDPNGGEGSSSLLTTVGGIIEGTKTTCNFIPTVASIAAIVGVPGAPIASELIDSICEQVDEIPTLESGRDAPRELELDLPEGSVDGVLLPS